MSRMYVFHAASSNASSPGKRLEAKSRLLCGVEGLERGLRASDTDRKRVEALVMELEKLNPTTSPLKSPLLNGKWRLVYTTSEGILGTSRPDPFRPRGPIYQTIDANKLKAKNQEPFPFYNGVDAELVPLSDSQVRVNFKTFRLGGFLPVQAPSTATGTLDTTYLDEELRVSRGNRGNLFVLVMEDPEERL